MRRRPFAVLAAAGLAAAPFVLPAAASPVEMPLPGCYTLADQVGDVADPDLDLVGAAVRTTGSSVQFYVRANVLRSSPRSADGHRFAVGFDFHGHRFVASASAFAHGGALVRDGAGTAGLTGRTTQLTVDGGLVGGHRGSGLTATFDTVRSFVILDLPTADLVRYGGGPLSGVLGSLEVTSAADAYVTTLAADTTVPRGARASSTGYVLGDNRCFGPPQAVLTLLSGTLAQYGDRVGVTARLQDASGAPLHARQVTVTLAGASVVASTGSDGLLNASLNPGVNAGAYPLTLTWAGDSTAGATTTARSFTVVPERTLLSLKSMTRKGDRLVQATLKDDDGQPVSGAGVTFTVSGSSARTLVTSAKGVVELHDLAKNVEVQAAFGGQDGRYTASSATVRTSNSRGNGRDHDD